MASSPSPDLDDYSASSTIITFDRPLSLLRGPIRAGSGSGSGDPFVLAFRDAASWRSAFSACEATIAVQCEAAARLGCAMSASSKCRPPWWRSLVGPRLSDYKEREICEEREMEECLAAAREKCSGFARERCLKSFSEARVSARGLGLTPKRAERLVCLATVMDKNLLVDFVGLKREVGATNFPARELIGSDSEIDRILGRSG